MMIFICSQIPEEAGFRFVIKLESVGDDAQINSGSQYATVTILASDYVRGLVQFAQVSRLVEITHCVKYNYCSG
jgi:hypothetical protein